jgi:hypothetical protein
MISPKLHAIWPVLFLILPQDLIVVLLVFFATRATANYCRAGIKSLRGTTDNPRLNKVHESPGQKGLRLKSTQRLGSSRALIIRLLPFPCARFLKTFFAGFLAQQNVSDRGPLPDHPLFKEEKWRFCECGQDRVGGGGRMGCRSKIF